MLQTTEVRQDIEGCFYVSKSSYYIAAGSVSAEVPWPITCTLHSIP